MRAVFLPQSESRTLVHTTSDCRKERMDYLKRGVALGLIFGILASVALGSYLATWQENIFDSQMRIVQAQHRAELEYERKRIARYAEIDALATAMDRARGE